MAFYTVPYKDLMSLPEISSDAKILYLHLESWFNYCRNNKKKCIVYFNQIESGTGLDTTKIIGACRELMEHKFMKSHPEKNAVCVESMFTMEE
ncbi:hypothetical protein [Klebsiella quasivariicola]|uniref:Uncharacterized protein n=1 Tax=Klebsiella quasivariicola TaxID=2026240 RepID=A0A8B4TLQ4_9ENTR|nr:hypothetical protein [Klebsiella quasivariicola]SXD86817.1 Uncharacterised protein [Klebsiella quasivariicola]